MTAYFIANRFFRDALQLKLYNFQLQINVETSLLHYTLIGLSSCKYGTIIYIFVPKTANIWTLGGGVALIWLEYATRHGKAQHYRLHVPVAFYTVTHLAANY